MTRGLAIVGHGKMGSLIRRLAPDHGFEVRLILSGKDNGDSVGLTSERLTGVDVAVEFSTPSAAPQNIRSLAALGIPVVSGTTGWFEQLPDIRQVIHSAGSALVWSANFSIGVFRFRQIISAAARLLAPESEYRAWGWEIHHEQKKDTPSGTLLTLARDMKEAGFERSISLSATRAGYHPGSHMVGFDSTVDTITIRHTARSRDGFALGALRAAQWIIGKQGTFEFRDIVDDLIADGKTKFCAANKTTY